MSWRWKGPKYGFVPVGVTDQGKQTIRAVELNQRDTLKLLRGQYYGMHISPLLKRHRDAKQRNDLAALKTAHEDAQRLAAPDAEYAGMARYVLRRAGLL